MATDAREHRTSKVGHLVDVFVFAPLGLALDLPRLWPELVDRGRSETRAALRGLGLPVGDHDDTADDTVSSPAPETPAGPATLPVPPEPAPPVEAIDPVRLAIPDYDSLSASQVVPRLVGLSADELELVRRYELSGRGRNTILSRVAQLQDS
jgi:hypothetical protein